MATPIPWQQSGRNAANDRLKALTAYLQSPQLHMDCGRYINSLNLQGKINAGKISEIQALQIVHIEIQKFERELHTAVNNEIMKIQNKGIIDQNDFNNALNTQLTLNSDSILNQNIADDQLTDDQTQNDQANTNQTLIDNDFADQTQSQNMQNTSDDSQQNTKMSVEDDLTVGAAFTEGVIALAKGEDKEEGKAAEDVLQKATGYKVNFDDMKKEIVELTEKIGSKSALPVPRPIANAIKKDE